MAAVFALLAITGARRGEVLALRWTDYDPKLKVPRISKSVGYAPDHGIYVKSTKTHNIRRLAVDETMEIVIFSQMEALKKNVFPGFDLAGDPYLFPGNPGGFGPVHPDTPPKVFRKVCDSLSLPYHLHQLRHFVATELIALRGKPRP